MYMIVSMCPAFVLTLTVYMDGIFQSMVLYYICVWPVIIDFLLVYVIYHKIKSLLHIIVVYCRRGGGGG